MFTQQEDLLTDKEVGSVLRITTAALARWRKLGEGPRFVRIGKRLIRYPAADLAEFIQKGGNSLRQP